jgi:serine/threonine protein kinase
MGAPRSIGRTVAVKFSAEGLRDDPESSRRFEREAQTLARLSHFDQGMVATFQVSQK